jgi:hypothetical protein
MSSTIEQAHANPAKPDAPPQPMAIVLTKVRVVRQGGMTYHVPVGSVISILSLPKVTTFNPGADAKLVPAGSYKVGDIVE